MRMKLRRTIASLLVACIAGLGIPLPAQAGMLATDTLGSAGDRERIGGILERAEVRAQLESHGVSPGAVKARIAALSDQEVTQLARDIEALPAGGNAVVGAIVLIFLVLLITDLLGLTKVFPFTRAQR